MQKVVTLKDVASVAGVSLATASRVINGHAGVSAQNRVKVEEAIRKLNYSPNAIARSLATGRTGTISLIIVQEDPIVPTTWSHELPIIQAIHDTVKTQNWELQITMCSYREFRQPSFLPHHLSRGTVDGVLILSAWLVERHVVAELKAKGLPFVIIGAHDPDYEAFCVEFDNTEAVRSLVKHLRSEGHETFALIGGAPDQLHMEARVQGFVSALQDCGLPIWNQLIEYGDWNVESGYALMQKLIQRKPRPTAVICGNDYLAVGAMQAIAESGLRIPEDIAVVGFDDTVVGRVTLPKLTTVRPPLTQLGRLGAERLVQELVGSAADGDRRVVLPCEVVIRASSKVQTNQTNQKEAYRP